MTVYMVIHQTLCDDYDQDVMGVFSNAEAAQACYDDWVNEYGLEGCDNGAYYNDGEHRLEIHSYKIEETYERDSDF